jgi:hypothetical protein
MCESAPFIVVLIIVVVVVNINSTGNHVDHIRDRGRQAERQGRGARWFSRCFRCLVGGAQGAC